MQCTRNMTLRCVHAPSCSEKAGSITHSECVFVGVCIRHAMRMHHIVICGLSGSTIFFHIISRTARFSANELLNTECVF